MIYNVIHCYFYLAKGHQNFELVKAFQFFLQPGVEKYHSVEKLFSRRK